MKSEILVPPRPMTMGQVRKVIAAAAAGAFALGCGLGFAMARWL